MRDASGNVLSTAQIAAANRQTVLADAAGDVRIRAGHGFIAGSSYASSYTTSYSSSFTSSYSSSYSSSYGGRHGVQLQPLVRVSGIAYESSEQPAAPAVASSSSGSAGVSAASTDPRAHVAPSAHGGESSVAPAAYVSESLPEQVHVDVFAGSVYHLYSRFYFNVLPELASPGLHATSLSDK